MSFTPPPISTTPSSATLSSPSPFSPTSAESPPGTDAPATCEVPQFAPVRVRGGWYGTGRCVRHRRRALAAGLAFTAAALVVAGPRDAGGARGHPTAESAPGPRSVTWVAAPVRIADGATVRLLRPGDRVDVIAARETPSGADARVVARGVRVTEVPKPPEGGADAADGGALVVVSVSRATATRLAGAGATARLAVTRCGS
ncbi:RcpC/CpaB family pilus assembly protein [Streptomyces sp. NPDC087294]|uniref:RcpC/CpaB family pilus assembly protein n=1 Tax=Streptomyces sp. NPDC087294 TaxID=3365777 RepID=UPI00381FFF43